MDSALWLTSTPANAGWCRGERKRSKASRSSVRPLLALFRGKRSLDGEIVHIYSDGKPLFHDLMRRRSPQHFYAFDLLWLNGRELQELPLIERGRLLRTLVCSPRFFTLTTSKPLFEAACSQDLEGIVAKLASGRYEPEATTWVKIKNRKLQPSGWSGGILR
jgi:ATP-dependent DNA ligase